MVAKKDGIPLLDFELDPSRSYTLGRSPSNDIQLEAPSISRLHAVIFDHDGNWMISDLGSSRGLRDEKGEVSITELIDGDWIALGPAFVWYRDERTDLPEVPKAKLLSEDMKKRNVLLIEYPGEDGSNSHLAFALDERKTATLGGCDSCDISIQGIGLEPLELVFFRIRSKWHVVGTTQNQLEAPDGKNQQSWALDADTPSLRCGPLHLSLLEALILPKIARLPRSGMEKIGPDDEVLIDSVDLEAAAKSGHSNGPEPPDSD